MRILLEDIGKQYGEHWIFQSVSQAFESSHVYPIIGNNGSGKSTLLQIISGFVTPNEGRISHRKGEVDLPVEQWYQHISMATPYLDLFEEFTVEESIALHQRLKTMTLENPAELMEQIDLAQHAKKPLSQLSSGMRQRLKLALAILSKSEVILLDEPSSNLDKRWTQWFNDTLSQHLAHRITIICSNSQSEEMACATDDPLDISALALRG